MFTWGECCRQPNWYRWQIHQNKSNYSLAKQHCLPWTLVTECRVIVLFGAEGVVTAAQSRHVQAGCRAASLLDGIALLRKICVGLCVSPQHVNNHLKLQFHFHAHGSGLHWGPKDGKQLGERLLLLAGTIKHVGNMEDCVTSHNSTWLDRTVHYNC